MKLLVEKGFLGHKPVGNNGFIYYPLIEREEYCGNNLMNVVYGREIGDVLKDDEGVANMRNLGHNMASVQLKLNS